MTKSANTAARPGATTGADQNAWVIERRRHARTQGRWAVRWIIGEYMVVLQTHALDASLHGLRLEIPEEFSGLLLPGQRHRIEVLLEGKRITRVAEVRHVTPTSVGFLIQDALPMEELLRAPADPARTAISHVQPSSNLQG